MTTLFVLFIALLTCHYLADYTHLSTPWMLSAKRTGNPLFPILCHASVHGALMLLALEAILGFHDVIYLVVIIQVTSHFAIDVLKGKLNVWLPSVGSPANKSHWYIFGADQLAHQLVIVLMVYIIVCHV